MVVKGKKTKNPPVLSHEFVIQNHADIVACVAMVFVVGLMFQISSPAASVFIALHHNVTVPTEIQPGVFQDVLAYTQGPKDIPAIFFYLAFILAAYVTSFTALRRAAPGRRSRSAPRQGRPGRRRTLCLRRTRRSSPTEMYGFEDVIIGGEVPSGISCRILLSPNLLLDVV